MNELFICPHCQKEIEITEALTHKIEEDVKNKIDAEHKEDLALAIKESERKVRKRIEEEISVTMQDRENELKEQREQNRQLREQMLETNKLVRSLKEKDEARDLETEKRITAERERARDEALKKISEDYRHKDMEKEKIINDLKKSLDEAKRKAEQGSMQTQGEVLELDLENFLKNAFPQDEFIPVGKGVSGADLKQIVKSPRGNDCGIILWEFKRTKAWSDDWISKLKNDVRSEKECVGALVSQAFPLSVKSNIEFYNGVWITNYANILPLALLLRKNILDVARQKFIAEDSTQKSQLLYSYITSLEFRQQLEALAETFGEMKQQIVKERIAYEKSWKLREGQVDRSFIGAASIIGSIEGTGINLPQIKGFDLLEDGGVELDEDHKKSPAPPTLLDV